MTRKEKTIHEEWEAVHRGLSPLSATFLSSSDPQTVLEAHGVYVYPGDRVLDIGVGIGDMAKHLHQCGCEVDALDIVESARDAVDQYVKEFYITPTALVRSTYDLAISNLVTQHITDSELAKQVSHVFRSLKPGGVLSMQCAGSYGSILANDQTSVSVELLLNGSVTRSYAYTTAIIEKAIRGKKEIVLTEGPRFPEYESYWYYLHISKPRRKASRT